jgi:hypothetical protein
MNRWTWLLGTALVTFGALSPLEAAAPAGVSVFSTYRIMPRDGQLRAVMGEGSVFQWAKAEDFPGLAEKRLTKTLRMRVDVDASDAITGCTVIDPTGHEAIDAAACPLIRKRAAFRHALALDGTPAAGEVEVGINFYFYDADFISPAPPPPELRPMVTPPAPRPAPAKLEAAPDWTHFAPVGWTGKAQVAVDLVIGGSGKPFCRIGQSSGNEAIDTATCAAVQAGTYSGYGRFGLLVDWKGARASYKTSIRPNPMDPQYDRHKTLITGVPAAAVTKPGGMAEVTFSAAKGITGCRVISSAGSDLADIRACETFRKIKYVPGEDVFGRRGDMKRIVLMVFARP